MPGGLFAGARQDPGVLGDPAPKPRRGFRSALSEIFAGAEDPTLSHEANEAARRQALTQAGLAMMLASGPQPVRPGLAQILAAGAMHGREAGGAARQQAALQAQHAALADPELLAQLTPQQRAIISALPPDQRAEVLAELLTARPQVVTPGASLVDPMTGTPLYSQPAETQLPAELRGIALLMGVDPAELTSLPPDRLRALLDRWEQFRRHAGTTVNIDTGTIPPGWRAVRDEAGNVVAMEPIEGGPAARDIERRERQQEAGDEATRRAAITVVEDVDRALGLLDQYGGRAAGFAGLSSPVPGTPAHRLRQHLESVKGNIGIDSLLRIKASGAGLGQVPQSQLDMLAGLLGRLDITMSPADLRFNLERIRQIYSDIVRQAGGNPLELFGDPAAGADPFADLIPGGS